MRWHPAVLVLLICALSKWLLATDIQIQDPSLAGMPLSDVEYENFFKTLNSPHRVSAVCFLRSMYGCQNALVQTLDLYENHGIVPEGKVCSDLPEMPSFPDFCTLTFYRCTLKKYFVKRIQCPDEISETSSTTENTNQVLDNTSSTLQETPLTSTGPPTLSPPMTSPPLPSVSNTPTAATETITTASNTTLGTDPEHPGTISITSTKPLLDQPISSTPLTTDSESLLGLLTSLDAVIAEQNFPELFTTTLNTAGDSSQHLRPEVSSSTPVPTLSSTSKAMTTTPVTSVPVVTQSSSEPTTPEATTPSLGSVSTNPATTVATSSSPTSVSTSPVVTATTTEPTTPSVSSVPTNPATTIAPASSPTTAAPSPVVTTTTTITSTTSSSSSPSPSSSTASKTSVLSTKPAIPQSPALVLPPARVAEWPIVPISAVLGQYPLQPTSVVQLLLVPPGFGPRKSKPQAIAISSLLPLGAGPAHIWQKKIMAKPPMNLPMTAKWEKLLQTKLSTAARWENALPTKPSTAARWENALPTKPSTAARSENALPTKPSTAARLENALPTKPSTAVRLEIALATKLSTATRLEIALATKPPTAARLENALPTNPPTNAKLENLLSRLRDDRVQQLMRKMRELMAKGKAVKKQLLQSTSLQLLSALKNAKQKAGSSLAAKKQLQR